MQSQLSYVIWSEYLYVLLEVVFVLLLVADSVLSDSELELELEVELAETVTVEVIVLGPVDEAVTVTRVIVEAGEGVDPVSWFFGI